MMIDDVSFFLGVVFFIVNDGGLVVFLINIEYICGVVYVII